MFEFVFAVVALGLAGLAKGLVGMGLPPIAMGLLVIVVSPVEAASIMVVPAVLTNVWQGVRGNYLRPILLRYWPTLSMTAGFTFLFSGAFVNHAQSAIVLLGALQVIYGAYGLMAPPIVASSSSVRLLGPVSGAVTGTVTAFTGVSSMPSVPFFQATAINRDYLVQALGLSFTVSNAALLIGLEATGNTVADEIPKVLVATGTAFLGMFIGSIYRAKLNAEFFRKIFFGFLVFLGAMLIFRTI